MRGDNSTEYQATYEPSLLQPVTRKDQRQNLGVLGDTLPFDGVDVWRAYEFTWLNSKGKPEVVVADFEFPVRSSQLIESKSMKLYLGSYANTSFGHQDEVNETLETDLTQVAQAPVSVNLLDQDIVQQVGVGQFTGLLLDRLDIDVTKYRCNPDFLEVVGSSIVQENLHTHLFRSLCPLTGQPDFASIEIQYSGIRISQEGLLRYLISYREHAEFAEQVAERIFVDIMNKCSPEELVVSARYTRRGGIEINSHRNYGRKRSPEVRLWRQ